MSDLVTWLRAQLDADERIARGARADYFTPEVLLQFSAAGDAAHVVTHDPARVLRQVAAMRNIVDAYEFAIHRAAQHRGDVASSAAVLVMLHVLKLAATIYADRDGYREEWRP